MYVNPKLKFEKQPSSRLFDVFPFDCKTCKGRNGWRNMENYPKPGRQEPWIYQNVLEWKILIRLKLIKLNPVVLKKLHKKLTKSEWKKTEPLITQSKSIIFIWIKSP